MVLTIRISKHSALRITRSALNTEKTVYIARANRKINYKWGRSYITYIGETTVGAKRIASSAAFRASEILSDYGIKYLDFYVIKCTGRKGVSSWEALERSLIITFREMYGEVPICNRQGARINASRKSKYFSEVRLKNIIRQYSD